MRQPLHSQPPEMGPAARLPGSVSPPGSQTVDSVTLDLLSMWQKEDATADPAELKAAEEELTAFMKAVNENRAGSDEPLVYP